MAARRRTGPVDFMQPRRGFPRDFLRDRKPSRPLAYGRIGLTSDSHTCRKVGTTFNKCNVARFISHDSVGHCQDNQRGVVESDEDRDRAMRINHRPPPKTSIAIIFSMPSAYTR